MSLLSLQEGLKSHLLCVRVHVRVRVLAVIELQLHEWTFQRPQLPFPVFTALWLLPGPLISSMCSCVLGSSVLMQMDLSSHAHSGFQLWIPAVDSSSIVSKSPKFEEQPADIHRSNEV